MRLQPLSVLDQERAADAVVGDQVGEAVENAVEHVLGRHAVLGVLDQLEQPLQLGFAPGEFGRQRHQLVAEGGERIVGIGRRRRDGLAGPEPPHQFGVTRDGVEMRGAAIASFMGAVGLSRRPAYRRARQRASRPRWLSGTPERLGRRA